MDATLRRRHQRGAISCTMLACAALLAGCGGGSSSSVVPPPGTTFPLQTALASLLATGYSKTATISGTATYLGVVYPISGTLGLSASPLSTSPTTFAGQSAQYTTLAVTGSLSVAGQTLDLTSSQQSYFTPALEPLGYAASGSYCVAGSPGSYPATVQVGDSGTVVTLACYSDASMTTPLGSETLGYKVGTAYSTTTATVSLSSVRLDTGGKQVSSSTDNYVISTAGALDLVSEQAVQTDSGVLVDMTLTAR